MGTRSPNVGEPFGNRFHRGLTPDTVSMELHSFLVMIERTVTLQAIISDKGASGPH